MRRLAVVLLIFTQGVGTVLAADAAPLPSRVTPVVLAARRAGPAVVNISTERIVLRRSPSSGFPGSPFDDLFDFSPRVPQRTKGLGSGCIVADVGYILTNAHVLEGTSGISVSLADKKRFQARLISADPASDLAVIKIDSPDPLPFIEMCTSADLMPGETVVALGNPFGYGHTVTAGVISAVKRDIVAKGRTVYRGLIQTDAAINPGSSGGPLVNVHGQLIGINTAIRASAQNIGFAIPVDQARASLLELLDFRTLNHTWLGLDLSEACRPGQPVSRRVSVQAVTAKGPADRAGLAAGDLVVALDGRPVRNLIDFKARILERKAGDTVRIEVRRADEKKVLPVKLARAPRKPARELARDRLGLALQDLTPELAEQLKLPVEKGLLVSDVVKKSAAARAGIRPGDVILQVEKFRVEQVDELGPVLDRLRKGQGIHLALVRGKFTVWLRLIAR